MITNKDSLYILDTNTTTYSFYITETGHLEHLYYGPTCDINLEAFKEKHPYEPGNTIVYDQSHKDIVLEDMCLEMSSYGKGDIREPFIELVHEDGSYTNDFLYEKSEITHTKEPYKTLPGSYGDHVDHLTITLKDKNYDLTLELHYYVYEECDVISRSAKLINTSDQTVYLERLMSLQLDFPDHDYVLSTFTGAWAREMHRNDLPVIAGKLVNSSYTGTSSNRANPFVILSRSQTTETQGEAYGFNLIYSGNHYECVDVSAYGKMRFVTGINPQSFRFQIKPNDVFEAPEAIMTYSHEGYEGMSHHMHQFVEDHIVKGEWRKKVRPILLNSWEASYFKVNTQKLLHLAKAAKKVGIELFVLDDGWFGHRDDDTSSLGDWYVNEKKIKGGMSKLVEDIEAMGMNFGLWVEPEMVNVDSDLYRSHPDWVLQIKDHPHSEGRNQRILDLTNDKVLDYLIEKMSDVFNLAHISYVKWDMNRIFSDVYSPILPPECQEEVFHRYVIGLYRLMDTLTKRFPHILFEGCASGGNRFDLGILSYFPQIWASDDTDAYERSIIQEGYSYGYPLSVISAHVSASPNHQTLRHTPLNSRFHIASFGVLGYELNLPDLTKEEKNEVKRQIELYKEWRDVFQYGTFYRNRRQNICEWTVVSKDKKRAVGMIFQSQVTPNHQYEIYQAKGLDPDKTYHFYNIPKAYNIKNFGDLVNTVSPIHIKQGSLIHHGLSKVITMPSETEDYTVKGSTLMSGIKLKAGFAGTGYSDQVRYFQDHSSRMYFIEAVEGEEDES